MSVTSGIKVGNAYITITPAMDLEAMNAELAKASAAVDTFYTRQSDKTKATNKVIQAYNDALAQKFGESTDGMLQAWIKAEEEKAAVSKSSLASVGKALDAVYGQAVKQEAARTAAAEQAAAARQRIALTTRDLEIKYGDDVADAYLTVVGEMQAAGQAMYLSRIGSAKQAVVAEVAAARQVAEAQTAAAEEAAAAWKSEQVSVLQEQVATQSALKAGALESLATSRSTLKQVTQAHVDATDSIVKGWKGVATSIERVGTNLTGIGSTLTMGVVAPLAMAGAALTDWGLKAADTFQSTQTSLQSMGLALKDANALMNNLTAYGIKTPYSVDDMLTYGTKVTRSVSSHNTAFNSSNAATRAQGSTQVAQESQSIIQMIGDLAAQGGVTDASQVSRGYASMVKILDSDRVNQQTMKQLESAINLPAEKIAQLLGYKDSTLTSTQVKAYQKANKNYTGKVGDPVSASSVMMQMMSNAKTTGGVSGTALTDALLKYWQSDPGAQGSASRLGEITFGSRLSNMKESAQQSIRQMFQSSDPKTGQLQYTGLGQSIMGKRVYNPKTKAYSWQGGLLTAGQSIFNDLMTGTPAVPGTPARSVTSMLAPGAAAARPGVSSLAVLQGSGGKAAQAGAIPTLLQGFTEGLTTLVSWVGDLANYVKGHPELTQGLMQFGKMAAVVGPLALVLGGVTKLFGSIMKAFSPLVSVGVTAYKALRGGGRVLNQVNAGAGSLLMGDGYLSGYRTKRADLNDGEGRNLAQRTVDKVRGNNSQADKLTLDISDYEASVKLAEDKLKELKAQITALNATKISELREQFEGAPTSLMTSAELSERALKTLQVEGVTPLNNSKLTALLAQFGEADAATEGLESKLKATSAQVTVLNNEKLAALDEQTAASTTAAEALKLAVENAADEVGKLDGKTLGSLEGRFASLTTAVEATIAAVVAPKVGLVAELEHLNDTDLSKVQQGLKKVSDSLAAADVSGLALGGEIEVINKETKLATGGVLPGYQPGVDSIPALLSKGEAVLRPEVAHAIGAPTINTWNAMAMRGQIARHAEGTASAGGGGPMALVWDALKDFNFKDVVATFGATLAFDASSAGVGGATGDNLISWGSSRGGTAAGEAAFEKSNAVYEWVEQALPTLLERVPTGWGQLAGILAAMVAPSAGKLFARDVWHGSGNVLARESKFTLDLLDPTTLWHMIENGGKSVWDEVSSIAGMSWDAITDPVGFVSKATGQLRSLVGGVMGSVTGMVDGVQQIIDSPGKYAGKVGSAFWSTAKRAMPNTSGLFDFSNWSGTGFATGGVLPGYMPGIDSIPAMLSPGEAVLRPEVAHAIGAGPINAWNAAASRGRLVRHAAGTAGTPGAGIAIGTLSGASGLATAIQKVYEIITKSFSSRLISQGEESSLNKWLDSENKSLQGKVNDRISIAAKLKTANASLTAIQGQESTMASDVSTTAKGTATLQSIFNSSGVSASALASGLSAKVAEIKTFGTDLSKLASMGFSKDIISELAKDGPDTGGQEAAALLDATKAQVSSINSSYSSISTASDALGNTVATTYYGAGVKAAQALVNGLKSQDATVVKQIEATAEAMVKKLQSALGVTSNTRVNATLATLLQWLTGTSQAASRKKTTAGYATGTLSASPGLALVGERGPELLDFQGGERVYTASQTASMLNGRKYEIHIHEAKSEDTSAAVLRAMRYAEVMYAV